jgi:hypothetical protein
MALTKGSWNITNLKGINRVFKEADSPDAIAWMSNRDDKAPPKPKAAPKPKKPKVEKSWINPDSP